MVGPAVSRSELLPLIKTQTKKTTRFSHAKGIVARLRLIGVYRGLLNLGLLLVNFRVLHVVDAGVMWIHTGDRRRGVLPLRHRI
jgi:hypothetical protein